MFLLNKEMNLFEYKSTYTTTFYHYHVGFRHISILCSNDRNGTNVLRSRSRNKVLFEKFFNELRKKTFFIYVGLL